MVAILTLIVILIGVTIGGLLVGLGVHFVPVGGAPAAMAQATGIGTGTTMLAFSSGALGLISAGFTYNDITNPGITTATGEVIKQGALYGHFNPTTGAGFLTWLNGGNMLALNGLAIEGVLLVIVAGIVGAMLMMVILAVVANILYSFAIAVPLVSAKVKFDPITGDRQDLYVTRGTEGHGTPTVAVISSLLGGLFGGAGGALLYLSFMASGFNSLTATIGGNAVNVGIPVAAFVTIGIFFVNSVLASYNITGTIEGFHYPKFKRVPRAIIACTIASFVMGIWAIALVFFGVGV